MLGSIQNEKSTSAQNIRWRIQIIQVKLLKVQRGEREMKTIVFLNNKGGVGKTASVTTIAHMLAARHGMRVLVADIDPPETRNRG